MQANEITQELLTLLAIASPTGKATPAADYCAERLASFGLPVARTARGGVVATVQGAPGAPARALTAHVDTLGAIVAEILGDGRLRVTPVGGLPALACDGAYVTVLAQSGPVTGTILPKYASVHVFGPRFDELKRAWPEMRLRLDAQVDGPEDVEALGIHVGDFVAVEPRAERTDTGFVKSRFLDDKASAAALLLAAREAAKGPRPRCTTYLHFSVYEEVGSGAPAGIPLDAQEIVAIDMAAVGEGQTSREDIVTICAKDSGGPYDYTLVQRLAEIAKAAEIPFVYDTYPFYSSDATAAARTGRDVRIGLFGPGVDASHTHERTHEDALLGTARLALAYIQES
ncbi:MAG: M42 family metallopeptidase [Thermaerobacter sp.]|nr:M42 family metallopeptidase [Thermaerobacter sp.]